MRLIDLDALLSNLAYDIGLDLAVDTAKFLPTVDAIPIKWIEKWRENKHGEWLKRKGLGKFEVTLDDAVTVGEMLEDWMEENEKSNT